MASPQKLRYIFTADEVSLFHVDSRFSRKEKKDAELTPNRRNVEKSSWAFTGYEVDYLRNDESYYDELCGIRERDSPTGTSHLCDILRINAENYNPR